MNLCSRSSFQRLIRGDLGCGHHYKKPKEIQQKKETFRERKKPKIYLGYVTYITKLIEVEPTTYEKETECQEWKKEMGNNIIL